MLEPRSITSLFTDHRLEEPRGLSKLPEFSSAEPGEKHRVSVNSSSVYNVCRAAFPWSGENEPIFTWLSLNPRVTEGI